MLGKTGEKEEEKEKEKEEEEEEEEEEKVEKEEGGKWDKLAPPHTIYWELHWWACANDVWEVGW